MFQHLMFYLFVFNEVIQVSCQMTTFFVASLKNS
nr:MAG TPA: hypothetical protein [Bacteriophage sp.]